MSLNRLFKERDRLRKELEDSPTYVRLQQIEGAIAVLEELEGGSKAATTVAQFGKLIGAAVAPAPPRSPLTTVRGGSAFITRIHEAVAALKTSGPLTVARLSCVLNGSDTFNKSHYSTTRNAVKRLKKWRAVTSNRLGEITVSPEIDVIMAQHFGVGEQKPRTPAKGKVYKGPPPVEPVKLPKRLAEMEKPATLVDGLLNIAKHTHGGDIDHFAGAAIAMGLIPDDRPRLRVGIVLRRLHEDRLLKTGAGGWVISERGREAIAKPNGHAQVE